MMDDTNGDSVTPILPGDELDLHHFHPRDVRALLEEYIAMCVDADITEVRVVHGKGKSVLKQVVRGVLEKNPSVLDFRDDRGNWGATIIRLRPEKNS